MAAQFALPSTHISKLNIANVEGATVFASSFFPAFYFHFSLSTSSFALLCFFPVACLICCAKECVCVYIQQFVPLRLLCMALSISIFRIDILCSKTKQSEKNGISNVQTSNDITKSMYSCIAIGDEYTVFLSLFSLRVRFALLVNWAQKLHKYS